MTTTQAPTLNDDAVLVILGLAEIDDMAIELRALNDRDCIRVAVVLDELVQRGLVGCEQGDYFPTMEALDAALDAEYDRQRQLAIARQAQR